MALWSKFNNYDRRVSKLDGLGELILDHLVELLVVEPVHLDSSPRFGFRAHIFLYMLLVVGDVTVDSEEPTVIS